LAPYETALIVTAGCFAGTAFLGATGFTPGNRTPSFADAAPRATAPAAGLGGRNAFLSRALPLAAAPAHAAPSARADDCASEFTAAPRSADTRTCSTAALACSSAGAFGRNGWTGINTKSNAGTLGTRSAFAAGGGGGSTDFRRTPEFRHTDSTFDNNAANDAALETRRFGSRSSACPITRSKFSGISGLIREGVATAPAECSALNPSKLSL
jgi:hypothetical protein